MAMRALKSLSVIIGPSSRSQQQSAFSSFHHLIARSCNRSPASQVPVPVTPATIAICRSRCNYSTSTSSRFPGPGPPGKKQTTHVLPPIDGAGTKTDKPKPSGAGPRFRSRGSFIDSLRIHVKGGAGGHGLPAKGGVGGKGGDVIVQGKKGMKLKEVVSKCLEKRYSGIRGSDASLFCAIGAPAPSTTIEVPLGISIISELGNEMGEVNEVGDKVIVAKGGDGGSPTNGFCGMKGDAHSILLDLKLIADVGFVGYPNAGKSTLLKAISRARPKIASYPFTTLRPNIGVIEFKDFRKISLADLPGLIEGAHLNSGMGHKFLKHVERTKLILFVVDIHGFQLGPKYKRQSALETIITLNRELELYLTDLAEKPAMLALNKMDLPDSYPIIESIREMYKSRNSLENYVATLPREYRPEQLIMFQEIVPISAKTSPESVNKLKETIRTLLDVNEDIKRGEIEEQIRAV